MYFSELHSLYKKVSKFDYVKGFPRYPYTYLQNNVLTTALECTREVILYIYCSLGVLIVLKKHVGQRDDKRFVILPAYYRISNSKHHLKRISEF